MEKKKGKEREKKGKRLILKAIIVSKYDKVNKYKVDDMGYKDITNHNNLLIHHTSTIPTSLLASILICIRDYTSTYPY